MPPKNAPPQKRPIPTRRDESLGSEDETEEDETDEEGSDFTDSEGSEESVELPPRRGPSKQPAAKGPVKGAPVKGPPGNTPQAKGQPPAPTAADLPVVTTTAPQLQPPATKAPPVQEPKKAPAVATLTNKPHDEEIAAGDTLHRKTPEPTSLASAPKPGGSVGPLAPAVASASGGGVIRNDHNDEFQEAGPSAHVETPRKDYGSPPKTETRDAPAELKAEAGQRPSLQETKPKQLPPTTSPTRAHGNRDSSSESSDEGEYDTMMRGQKGGSSSAAKEYNPEEYEHVNRKVTAEVRQLFGHITAYHPTTIDLPTKLRPFIPEYYPAVGDMDTFCKVPRPDQKPDTLGLVVVDEPCSEQSNPAVIKIGLVQSSKVSPTMTFVDSVEDAHNRPQVIDKWVTDIKALQHKKPLPTVNYTKPMTDIEKLLQVWPVELEDMFSSDVAFPPPQIDLDISQYVRLLCTMLDIPTYTNLIESLHVMFTLYLEFRANQHFQHV